MALKRPDPPNQGRLFKAEETSPAYAAYKEAKAKVLQPQQFSFHEALAAQDKLSPDDPLIRKAKPFYGMEDIPAWHVREVPLHEVGVGRNEFVNPPDWEHHDWEQARSASKRLDELPPILLGRKRAFYDGTHRLVAHHLAGRKKIKAFVPVDEP